MPLERQAFLESLRTYANKLQDAYTGHIGVDASPEEQLKAPVAELIRAAADALGIEQEVDALGEVRANEAGRPDIGVTKQSLLTGHVELKKPGKGANPHKFKGHDKRQWNKFKNLPNLVYSDGTDFTHYRSGERVGKTVRLSGDPTVDGEEAVTEQNATALLELFRDFLDWEPIVPKRPKALAELLAPVCRLLREEVEEALKDPDSPLTHLATDWRTVFFLDATDREFADAYAQTLTYALLLARFSGADELSTDRAVTAIRPGHRLLAETLRVLGDSRARAQVETPLSVLERILGAVNPRIFERQGKFFERAGEGDPWLYFYEDFLAAYDRQMRKDRGVYFTPWQVVQSQVRLAAQLLEERFDAPGTFADENVITLDPACGTGTYILAAVRYALDQAAARRGEGARGPAATRAAKSVHAFEILVGPYAVAHLRLTQQIMSNGGSIPSDGAHVYLTDTLESPNETPPGNLPFALQELSEEHRRAQRVKRDVPVLVCIGNPPYDRQQAEAGEVIEQRKGGWIRYASENERPLLEDFLDPLRETEDTVHAKNLYNDYVYFWRWALWKVCETQNDNGIVSFITASSYLRGPGFKGMRQVMREELDELWILNLGGDNLGARKSDNVFAIQTPVCIAIGVRHPEDHERRQSEGEPAHVRYARIEGSEEEKLDALEAIDEFDDVEWTDCPTDWTSHFLPAQSERFAAWPKVTDIFPWQESGMQFKRKWPIAPDEETLRRRWRALLSADDRATALKETRDLKVDKEYLRLGDRNKRQTAIADLPPDAPMPEPSTISYRSFDRQLALVDNRLGDYLRPKLQMARSEHQVYITSFLTEVLGNGPSAIAAGHLPDLHHFRGSYGGRHIIPLWRDKEGTDPNLAFGVREVLEEVFGEPVAAEDVFAYTYAILSAPDYVEEFWEALEVPGPRLPITQDVELFKEAAALGRELLWLHTYGDHFVPEGKPSGTARLPQGESRITRSTPTAPKKYPDEWSYDAEERTLVIGETSDHGIIRNVPPEVMAFSISSFEPVKSWLDNRMKSGSGRTSSPLDDIRPQRWSFDDELLDLIWVLEATLERHPRANHLLGAVLDTKTFEADEFHEPTEEERKGPKGDIKAAPLFESAG